MTKRQGFTRDKINLDRSLTELKIKDLSAKKRKEEIMQLALNHRSQLSTMETEQRAVYEDEYNIKIAEVEAEIAMVEAEIKEKEAEILELEKELADLEKNQYEEERNLKMETTEIRTAKSIGEHFVENVAEKLQKRGGRFNIQSPEFVRTSPHLLSDSTAPFGPWTTTVDPNIVTRYRRMGMRDMFATGTLSGNAITFARETGRVGNITSVAEGGRKPLVKYTFEAVTEALKKVAGVVKVSNEMMDDTPFLVSTINQNLVDDLRVEVNNQLVIGNGTGSNIRGILNQPRVILRPALPANTTAQTIADAIYSAMTDIQINTGYRATGIAMNPADWLMLRTAKDSNQNYLAGGPFQNVYSGTGIVPDGELWGLPVVTDTAVPKGQIIVGAFNLATVYTKGGITVDSTNSNEDDFMNNLVAFRAEERATLAVRRPDGFIVVRITQA